MTGGRRRPSTVKRQPDQNTDPDASLGVGGLSCRELGLGGKGERRRFLSGRW